jgi:hypothetical protein
MGLHSSHYCPTLHESLPLNGLFYAQLHIVLLYSHKHVVDNVTRECIGSHFNQSSTLLARNLHSYRAEIITVQVEKEKPSPSKRTNSRLSPRLAR